MSDGPRRRVPGDDEIDRIQRRTQALHRGELPEATKHDSSKVRLELLPPDELIELGWVYTSGAAEYGDRNYLEGEGLNPDRLYGAVQRHLLAWKSGQQFDEATGHSHLMHAAAGLFMIRELENRCGRSS